MTEVELKHDDDLRLNGKSTDLVWLMADGNEPHVIGIRMDCGDSGTVYLTRDQAKNLAEQLLDMLKEPALAKPEAQTGEKP